MFFVLIITLAMINKDNFPTSSHTNVGTNNHIKFDNNKKMHAPTEVKIQIKSINLRLYYISLSLKHISIFPFEILKLFVHYIFRMF